MTERGVTPSPTSTVNVPTSPEAKGCAVIAGRTYELRTDAMEVDAGNGIVLYPLVFVCEGGGSGNRMLPVDGTPFSRMTPLRVTPQSERLRFTAEIPTRVWVSLVSENCDDVRDPTPAGAGCGCSGGPTKTSCGCSTGPTETSGSSCGCKAKPKPTRW